MSAVEPVYRDDLETDALGRVICPMCGGVMIEDEACEGATWLECEECGWVELAVEGTRAGVAEGVE